MARPLKQGIDYFPLDVGFLRDVKVRKIMKACGVSAPTILICLVGYIYKDYGYFLCWDEEVGFLVADEVGVSEALVLEVLQQALRVDFFNQKLFDEHKVITSTGIQKRYFAAVARRSKVEVIEKYCLLPRNEGVISDNNLVFVDRNSVPAYNNSVSVNKSTQSKEKKSKVKEIKEEIVFVSADASTHIPKTFTEDSIEYKSSVFLIKKILERDSKAKVPKTEVDIQKWCSHIDYILRLDEREPSQLKEVLIYATSDPFWSSNILSTKKLRDKYSTMLLQMQSKKGNRNNNQDSSKKDYISNIYED